MSNSMEWGLQKVCLIVVKLSVKIDDFILSGNFSPKDTSLLRTRHFGASHVKPIQV